MRTLPHSPTAPDASGEAARAIGLHWSRAAGRLATMLGGEAMQSALTFALNLALLQVLPARDYGVFALVMVIGGIALTYIRALSAMPASVLIGRDPESRKAAAYDVTFGTAALLVAVPTAAVSAAILGLWIEGGAAAGGLFVGLWALRSHIRTTFFAYRRQKAVALGDAAYILAGCACALPIVLGEAVLPSVLAILAVANALGIAVMLGFARRPLRLSLRRVVRRRYLGIRSQIAWSVVSVTTMNVQGQGLAFMVAGLAGPAAYAPIAAALVLFVPLRLMGTALANMMQPDLSARLGRGEVRAVWRSGLAWMGLMVLCGLGFGAAMVPLFRLVPVPFPESSAPGLVLALAWIFTTVVLVSVMPRITLEIMGAFRMITLITAGSAVLGLGLGFAILMAGQPSLALAGGVVSELAVLAASLLVVRSRKSGLVEGRPQPSLFHARTRRAADGPADGIPMPGT